MESSTLQKLSLFEETTKKNILEWLEGPYDQEVKANILRMLASDPQTLRDAFFQRLSFGTGGARGIMGIGTNRFNVYTVRAMSQGLANYLALQFNKSSVVIGYDNRNNSQFFAKETARVLAGNGIKVYLFAEMRPTPLVSFACREKKCQAAVMITASHNPPEYNGYKVYWSDGGQVLPPHDVGIIAKVAKIVSPLDVKLAAENDALIEIIYDEIDKKYIEKLHAIKNMTVEKGDELKIVYTNLHGAGITLMPQALSDWGYKSLSFVEKQKTKDGNFTFAPNPNPENRDTLQMGILQMLKEEADILIATDPDADRLALAINHHGSPIVFSGNQLACLLLSHLLEVKKMPVKPAFIKSIVTTELFKAMVQANRGICIDVLTGFKYIAEKMHEWEIEADGPQFILGVEESYGYLAENFVRDKDAISAGCLFAECALMAKKRGLTLLDIMYGIYDKYGIFQEKQVSINFDPGQAGMQKMKTVMGRLRSERIEKIANCKVKKIDDYEKGVSLDLSSQTSSAILLPKADVLAFFLTDSSKLVIRSSGTEPKIKIYAGVFEANLASIEESLEFCNVRLQALIDGFFEEFMSS